MPYILSKSANTAPDLALKAPIRHRIANCIKPSKSLIRSALPTEVSRVGQLCGTDSFSCFFIDPRRSVLSCAKRQFFLCAKHAQTGRFRRSVGVFPTSVLNSPHRATRWLTGDHICIIGDSFSSSSETDSVRSISLPSRALKKISRRFSSERPSARYAL